MATSRKLERENILNYFGNNQEAINFADALERILFFDKTAMLFTKNNYALNTTRQHALLKETLKNCNNLLTILQPLKRSEGQLQFGVKFLTARQIQNSLWYLNREKRVEQDADLNNNVGTNSSQLSDASKAIDETIKRLAGMLQPQPVKNIINGLDACEITPEDDPNAVIEYIEKLRDAVVHAIDQTIPKLGRIDYRTPHFNRKTKLGREFVQAYLMCFGKFPPKSIDNPAYRVFVQFLYVANLAGEVEEHCYKSAIDAIKNKKSSLESTKKMSISEQSGTKKDKAKLSAA